MHDRYTVVQMGDSPEMALELTELMLAGTKRATASLVRDFETTGEALPQPGDYVIVVDGAGMPRCIWQTTEVTIKPLIEVDEAFAWDEGEGARTRTSWLNGHRRYFARQASREGFAIDDQIPTVFERFKAGFPEDGDRVRGAVRNRGGLPGLLDRGAYLDEFAFRHNRRKTRGVGRIAARVIEQLVARQPLTMRTLIDDTRLCRWFRSAQPA